MNYYRNDSCDSKSASLGNWNFKALAPKELQSHMERSIPGYKEGHRLITKLSNYFIQADSRVYDMGCGPGDLLKSLSFEHIEKPSIRLIGVDPYIREYPEFYYNERFSQLSHKIEFIGDFCQKIKLIPCDIVIFYYTLQFIPLHIRSTVLEKSISALRPGGVIFIFEKTYAQNSRNEEILSRIYTDYKIEQDFSSEEIVSKMFSLVGKLVPNTSAKNISMLNKLGINNIEIIYKKLAFEGLMGIK
ncbi:hypothetical protein [Prochlorococcus sp. MIT 1306]|uniref:hypothetical protein n=1 Tax=Prochlorococcus sp. MIT 1306 TaxID=1799667 RepID=UPI0007B3203A|nr:hypothetical protein [Prochlorococcus sp. MIT 1306]KZR65029.1 tRNA (cmo5U34)-methyltransferase [Prochlorococcus sp. MIT 1306]